MIGTAARRRLVVLPAVLVVTACLRSDPEVGDLDAPAMKAQVDAAAAALQPQLNEGLAAQTTTAYAGSFTLCEMSKNSYRYTGSFGLVGTSGAAADETIQQILEREGFTPVTDANGTMSATKGQVEVRVQGAGTYNTTIDVDCTNVDTDGEKFIEDLG